MTDAAVLPGVLAGVDPSGAVTAVSQRHAHADYTWSEPTLLRLAFAYEQATKHRRPPTFAPTEYLRPAEV